MSEAKKFSTAAILSVTTGRLLCKFEQMHELSEWLLGHPIWTHEFADEQLHARLKKAVFDQYPTIATTVWIDGSDWKKWLAKQVKHLGASFTILKGKAERSEHPLESLERLAPGKPVIAIEVRK